MGGVRVGLGLTFPVGWLEIWRVKLISTQVVVEVEVGVELGNKLIWHNSLNSLFE